MRTLAGEGRTQGGTLVRCLLPGHDHPHEDESTHKSTSTKEKHAEKKSTVRLHNREKQVARRDREKYEAE